MKWKLIESRFDDTECSECSNDIAEHEACYWKKDKGQTKGIVICTQCYKRYGSNVDAQATTATTATATTAATTPPSIPPAEEGWSKAHTENMAANAMLCEKLGSLSQEVHLLAKTWEAHDALLKKQMEAKA